MANYGLPPKGAAYTFYIGLVDQSNTKLLKQNPTIASGDFKISKDGGAFANLGTLPDVNPASGAAVRLQLSGTEMNADNIAIACVDQAGAEWCDQLINIQTVPDTIPNMVWDEVLTGATHNVTNSAGKDLRTINPVSDAIRTGTCQSGSTSTTAKLDSGASAVDQAYQYAILSITGGTGSGQSRYVTNYAGSTKVATVNTAWSVTPDNTSSFEITPTSVSQVISYATGQDPASQVLATPANKLATDSSGRVTTTYGLHKNTSLSNFEFPMVGAADHVTPKTGLTVSGTVSIDGASFAALTNAPSEVGNGIYKVNLTAADLNGTNIVLRFSAPGADATLIGLVMQS